MKWAYGVTTVPERRADLLPRTLASLRLAGFDQPRLFLDGAGSDLQSSYKAEFDLEVTSRFPAVRGYGNWILALGELLIREPRSDLYALFQDDFVTVRNLRLFLERSEYPDKGYLNLFTFSNSEASIAGRPHGWYEGALLRSGSPYQCGRGAVALIFSREALTNLLTNIASVGHLTTRIFDLHRGHKAIDGAVVSAMNRAGWREYVHNPSLVQHTGEVSSMGNRKHAKALSFPGEECDALQFLQEGTSSRAQSVIPSPPAPPHSPPPGPTNHPALTEKIGQIRAALATARESLALEENPNGRTILLRRVGSYENRLRQLGEMG